MPNCYQFVKEGWHHLENQTQFLNADLSDYRYQLKSYLICADDIQMVKPWSHKICQKWQCYHRSDVNHEVYKAVIITLYRFTKIGDGRWPAEKKWIKKNKSCDSFSSCAHFLCSCSELSQVSLHMSKHGAHSEQAQLDHFYRPFSLSAHDFEAH